MRTPSMAVSAHSARQKRWSPLVLVLGNIVGEPFDPGERRLRTATAAPERGTRWSRLALVVAAGFTQTAVSRSTSPESVNLKTSSIEACGSVDGSAAKSIGGVSVEPLVESDQSPGGLSPGHADDPQAAPWPEDATDLLEHPEDLPFFEELKGEAHEGYVEGVVFIGQSLSVSHFEPQMATQEWIMDTGFQGSAASGQIWLRSVDGLNLVCIVTAIDSGDTLRLRMHVEPL